ncbi:MAG: uncharacterized protein JWM80_5191 [Cyanobacteria bacterium RYN_339]|nr:uncharacterized protein [Cyanobacteria bacterium RYN_339]
MIDPHAQLAALGWLAGTWCNDSCEAHYSSPAGGLILSYTKHFDAERVTSFEHERFEVRDGQVVEVPAPGGAPSPVVFTLVSVEPDRAVFENLKHDFPTRITYLRRANKLEVLAEGQAGKGFMLELELVSALEASLQDPPEAGLARFVAWYEKDPGNALIGRFPLNGLGKADLRRILGVGAGVSLVYTFSLDGDQLEALRPHFCGNVDPSAYDYFLECNSI